MGFTDKTINELINTQFECSCGRTHIANIENIAIGPGAIEKLPEFLETQKLADGRVFDKNKDLIFIVSDVNTEKAAGADVTKRLEAGGFKIAKYVLPHPQMHSEEQFVDEINDHLPEEAQLLIAVGSGSVNDMTRFVSFKKGVPYYIVGTAPSMDGYASNVSPIVHNNLKITYPAHCAAAIIGDTDYLATAPMHMIAAGLGDVLGKYLAISDWKLSQIINGEYCCPEVCELVLYSVEKCVATVDDLKARDPQALTYLMESLVLIGIAMSFIGNSRPASSSEHHISHFLEMKAIQSGEYGELHGTDVGMATCMIGQMYDEFLENGIDYDKAREHAKAFDHDTWVSEIKRCFGPGAPEVIKLYETARQDDPDEVLRRIDAIEANEDAVLDQIRSVRQDLAKCPALLEELGGLTDPSSYPFAAGEMTDIITYAKDLRNRYGTLQVFYDLGILEPVAADTANRYMKK